MTSAVLSTSTRRRLLCVTADAAFMRDVVDRIDGSPFDVEYVGRFREAVARINDEHFDGCITDFMIRRSSALELLHVLHHSEYDGPVIVITDATAHRLDAQYLPLGVTDFIDHDALTPGRLERAITYGLRSKEREQRLKQDSQISAENLRQVAQELRTPLNAIIGFTNHAIPRVEPLVPARDTAALRTVLECGRELDALISDLVDIADIEAKHVKLALQPVNVATALQDVVHELSAEAADHGLRLISVASDPELFVTADRHRLHQVVYNFVSNAIKYTERGTVMLHGSRGLFGGEEMVMIGVKDTGVGIKDADLPFLFDRFTPVLTPVAKSVARSGLGLPICDKLVALHGGYINVDSQRGEGSEFRVWLPLANRRSPSKSPRRAAVKQDAR